MDNKQIDPMSRDYDPASIVPDERFTQTAKEFWITMLTYSVFVLLGADPSKYTYVLGMPLWIFLEILIIIGMVVAQELIATFVYKDMDVTPRGSIRK